MHHTPCSISFTHCLAAYASITVLQLILPPLSCSLSFTHCLAAPKVQGFLHLICNTQRFHSLPNVKDAYHTLQSNLFFHSSRTTHHVVLQAVHVRYSRNNFYALPFPEHSLFSSQQVLYPAPLVPCTTSITITQRLLFHVPHPSQLPSASCSMHDIRHNYPAPLVPCTTSVTITQRLLI